MSINLDKLEQYFVVDKLIYHSIDLSLYQVSAVIDGNEHYVTDRKSKLLRGLNLSELQKIMKLVKAKSSVLRHTSAYDEMIGGPDKNNSNMLEVPIQDNQLY
jgi:hypothetical protein